MLLFKTLFLFYFSAFLQTVSFLHICYVFLHFTAFLLIVAALIRIFAIPKFLYVPGKFQMLLEQVVGMFDNLAKSNSPHRNGFLGAYIFAAGVYIFVGTLFELFGVQAVSISGASITLPAPLSDVNGAIALGCLSYLIILSGGIAGNGFKATAVVPL